MIEKAKLVKLLAHATEKEAFRNNVLTLITPYGVIKGTVVTSESDENTAEEEFAYTFYDTYINKCNNVNPYPAIPLKNVTLQVSPNYVFEFATLLVFPEQIIAATLNEN